MSTTEKLPADYAPYKELEFCSNHFVNTPIALEIGGNVPLLIGSGTAPRVWLSAPTSKDRKHWASIVTDNKSQIPNVSVQKRTDGTLEVFAGHIKLLEVKSLSTESAVVRMLDLRPIGFNIHGDTSVLWIGTNQFSNNTIANCKTGIGIGA